MKISARNQIKGTVKEIREGAVNAVVVICRGNHNPIKADITMESVKALGLEEGKECYAVVKATNVMFATSKIEGISARNQIEGKIVSVKEGAVNGHVTIEDADGAQISGSITRSIIHNKHQPIRICLRSHTIYSILKRINRIIRLCIYDNFSFHHHLNPLIYPRYIPCLMQFGNIYLYPMLFN